MKRCVNILAALFFCCAAGHVAAATQERVIAVLPDGSITLEHTGKASFANIRFPELKQAGSWLAAHVLQQEIPFEAGETERYGRVRITSENETDMLEAGIAVIYASEGEVPAVWFAREAAARASKRGIWAKEDFLLTPENAAQHKNEFHVVEGQVTRVYANRTVTYLNFGKDWHSDFSITIPASVRRRMGDRLDTIHAGSEVCVRGRLYEENGPMVMLNHADNLQPCAIHR